LERASLNAITFAFWWSKPLGVQEPVNIYAGAEVAREEIDRKDGLEEAHGLPFQKNVLLLSHCRRQRFFLLALATSILPHSDMRPY